MFRKKPIDKWVGSYLVKRDKKMLTMYTDNQFLRASVEKVNPFSEDGTGVP